MSGQSTDPVLPMFPKPQHAMGPGEPAGHQLSERDRQLMALRADAPMRPRADQDDTTECPLFQAVDQGRLL